ncbi:MAG: hypothetical protein H6R00_1717 [Proteobacteria bacterium]|nr:hypothetical protein [Pseudomonadota bacterium]
MAKGTPESYRVDNALLTARPDGQIQSSQPVLLPIMAPRLQADLFPDGRIKLALWGAGALASIRFSGWAQPYVFAPNRLTAANGAALVAQSQPVMLLRNARVTSIRPASRCAWWGLTEPRRPLHRRGERRLAETGWGWVIVETRGTDTAIACGASLGEAETALALSSEAIADEAAAYVERCDGLPEGSALLRGMVSQGLHAALSSIRRNERNAFAGLAAGQAYSAPARTYYRDGYWTHQALLPICPEVLADQIDILAEGMQDDGEAPSGVIMTGPMQSLAWEQARLENPNVTESHLRPGDWWSDHFDSPLFFVLTIDDYVRTTGDDRPLRKHLDKVRAVYRRYAAFAAAGQGLPQKPRHDRDWADNVYRGGSVSYDVGLWVGTLEAIVRHCAGLDPELAAAAATSLTEAKTALAPALLLPQGWYADYRTADGFTEDHLTLDSLTLLRFGAAPEQQARAILGHVASRLETRANAEQPYGDWGVMCAFPPFRRRSDTRAKSSFPYRYHNGSDWPYLSALYADERLKRGLDGWYYPLTRWWRTCLDQGWMGAVEYFSPPYGRGSLLQGWSSLATAVILAHRERVMAGDPDADGQ